MTKIKLLILTVIMAFSVMPVISPMAQAQEVQTKLFAKPKFFLMSMKHYWI